MKIEFKINVDEDREPKMLEYLNVFAKMLLLGEDETLVDVKINDVAVEDTGICIY